jgi:hypothetical protein
MLPLRRGTAQAVESSLLDGFSRKWQDLALRAIVDQRSTLPG